jgi:hypothetical protein
MKWKAPRSSDQYRHYGSSVPESQGYSHMKNGVMHCGCGYVAQHQLSWPDDAFWRWDIRGEILWAWNRDHAQAIVTYVSSKTRSRDAVAHKLGPYVRKLPTEFLHANVRELITKKIRKSLEELPNKTLHPSSRARR